MKTVKQKNLLDLQVSSDTQDSDWCLILDCVQFNVPAGKLTCSFQLHKLPDWLPNVALVQSLLLSLHRVHACPVVGC